MAGDIVVLEDAQVRELLVEIDVQGALLRMFRALADRRAVQPAQTLTLLPDEAGDVITYAGVLADAGAFGVKLSPYLARDSGGLVTAWTLLMSLQTGRPLMLCDAKRLTTERTAGTTALALDLLAPEGVSTLAVIGAGEIAQAHLRRVLPLRNWKAVRVHSRGVAALPAATAAHLTGLDPRVRLQERLDDAVAEADVILLCTSSATPVLQPGRLVKPALITSISTNAPRAHEVPPAALAQMEVYCDDAATTPAIAGEMVLAAESGLWSPDRVRGDLAGLATGRSPGPRSGKPAFFRSVGLGLEDIVLAVEIHRAHQARPAGAGR